MGFSKHFVLSILVKGISQQLSIKYKLALVQVFFFCQKKPTIQHLVLTTFLTNFNRCSNQALNN